LLFSELKKNEAMYTGLLHTHSLLRYFILIGLVVVIIKALIGLINNQPYGKWDNKLGLYLFIFTHMQLLIGLILYFVSPFVKFGETTMSDKTTRYWTVEHAFAMLVAVVLITLARTTSKRMTDDQAKHKRMAIFNFVALVVILAVIWLGGRPIV
jgi:uncharacterized membrane protein